MGDENPDANSILRISKQEKDKEELNVKFSESWFEDEVRDGFYVPAFMKRAWAAELEVLERVADICKKYGIHWFADSGTLLGAARHGGFIPWDDDMDIAMFREDYDRFIAVAQEELPEGYNLWRKRGEDWHEHIKIYSLQSMYGDSDYMEKHHGFPFCVWLDIFPLDYMAPDPEDEEIRDALGMIVWSTALRVNEETRDTEDGRQLIEYLEKLVSMRFDQSAPLKEQLYVLREKIFSMYPREEAGEVACMPYWLANGTCRYPLRCFEGQVMLPFEGTSLPAPSGFDEELSLQYGDYRSYCRSGEIHQYPFYQHILDAVGKGSGPLYEKWIAGYQFHPEHLRKERERTLWEDFISIAGQAHEEILDSIKKEDSDTAIKLLSACQDTAVQVGASLEKSGGGYKPNYGDPAFGRILRTYMAAL